MRVSSKCNQAALSEFKAGKGYHLIYMFKGLLRLLSSGQIMLGKGGGRKESSQEAMTIIRAGGGAA